MDVFTRWREKYDPRIQQLGENARVIHIESGPIGYWPKMEVYDHLDEFTAKLDEHVAAEGRSYDLIHAHYWLSASVARTLAARWRVPRIQMFHTLGLVKREVMDEDVDGESDVRVAIERQAVEESAAVVAASEIELGELRDLYGADPAKVHIIPCGVDPDGVPADADSGRARATRPRPVPAHRAVRRPHRADQGDRRPASRRSACCSSADPTCEATSVFSSSAVRSIRATMARRPRRSRSCGASCTSTAWRRT